MTLDFHFTDTPPQAYLDDLHAIDVPQLFDPLLSKPQRGNLLVLIKKRLGEWQGKVRDQIKQIEGRYGNDEKKTAMLLTAPYRKLEGLGKDLNNAILNLEKAHRAGRVIPAGFAFGEQIFGDLERGEWHFGDYEDVHLWDDYITLRRRMETIGAEYRPLLENVKISQARVKQQTQDIKDMMATYKRRSNPIFITLRVLPVFIVMVFALAAGWFVIRSETQFMDALSNLAVGGMLMIIGTAAAIMMIIQVRRRRQDLAYLRENITEGKRFLKQLQAAFKQARIDFYPTDKLYKELQKEYKVLKATFPTE